MKRAQVVAIASLALLALTHPARAADILEPADAEELAAALAEATAEQDICYGWRVDIDDDDGGHYDGVEFGSSLGVGRLASEPPCTRYIVFTAAIHYTSSSSEAEDGASFGVSSNVVGAPTEADLRRAGITGGRLLGGDDDVAIVDATLALPLLAAQAGLAPPIPLEPNQQDLPSGDRPTGTPGSDFVRNYGAALAVGGIAIAGGLGLVAYALAAGYPEWSRADRSRRRRSVPDDADRSDHDTGEDDD